jgi:hypothetical protein
LVENGVFVGLLGVGLEERIEGRIGNSFLRLEFERWWRCFAISHLMFLLEY